MARAMQDAALRPQPMLAATGGGASCPVEDPDGQQGPNAIKGLHSSWVGERRAVLAMARPWQQNIVQHGLAEALRRENIGMVLNLQEVGEHAECGPGLLPQSGLSYDPETLMAAGIHVYHFGWRDQGVPDLDRMMDIVQAMHHEVVTEGRRVAVHGHAGVGRTALAIACFLVYSEQLSARRAVEVVRRDRQGALRNHRQEAYVQVFERCCMHLRCLFASTLPLPLTAPSSPTEVTHSAIALDTGTPGKPPAASGGGKAPQAAAEHKQVTEVHPSGLVIVRGVKLPSRAGAQPSDPGHATNAVTTLPGSAAAANQPGASKGDTKQQWPSLPLPPHLQQQQQQQQQGGALAAAPTAGSHPSQEEDGTLTLAELGLDPALPWAQDFTPPLHGHACEWQPKPPASYQAAMHRQRRLQHGSARHAFLHLHRFVGEAVLGIIAAARQHAAAPLLVSTTSTQRGMASAFGMAVPLAPSAAALPVARSGAQKASPFDALGWQQEPAAVQGTNWLSTQSMATGPQRPHQQQQLYATMQRASTRQRQQGQLQQQPSLQQRPSLQQQQSLQQRPSLQKQESLQQRPSLGAVGLPSRPSGSDQVPVLLAPPSLPRGPVPPTALQPSDSAGSGAAAARHLATTASGRFLAASSSLKRASDEGGGGGEPNRASYTGDATATVQQRRSNVGEKPLASGGAEAVLLPGVVLSPRPLGEGVEGVRVPSRAQNKVLDSQRQPGSNITNLVGAVPRPTSRHLSTTVLPPWNGGSVPPAQGQTKPAAVPASAQPIAAFDVVGLDTSQQQQQQQQQGFGQLGRSTSSGGGSATSWSRRSQRRIHPNGPEGDGAAPALAGPALATADRTSSLRATATNNASRHRYQTLAPVACFADALLRCADPAARDSLLDVLARDPAYARFALPDSHQRASEDGNAPPTPATPITSRGPPGSLPTVAAHAQTLQAEADAGELGGLSAAPVTALVLVLEHLMGRLTATTPALSDATLRCARDNYENLPFEQLADTGAAWSLLGPLPADDQELLLLFAALLRHAALAGGGAGQEEYVKGLVGWVLRLLLGPQMERQGAAASQEAMTCVLWYLVRNDAAFAALVMARHQRVDGAGGMLAGGAAGLALRVHREEAVSVSSTDQDPYAMAAVAPVPQVFKHSGIGGRITPRLSTSTNGAAPQPGAGNRSALPPALTTLHGAPLGAQHTPPAAAPVVTWTAGGHVPQWTGGAGAALAQPEQEQEAERPAVYHGFISETTAATQQQRCVHDVWV